VRWRTAGCAPAAHTPKRSGEKPAGKGGNIMSGNRALHFAFGLIVAVSGTAFVGPMFLVSIVPVPGIA
jgi:hypothetical protein